MAQSSRISVEEQEINKKKRTILATDIELKFKIVLVGDSSVGKTSIFWRYIEDLFDEDEQQESTVTMVDFRIKNQIIDSDLVKLYLWDTAGQEKYRAVVGTYFKGAHAIIGVFDLSDFNSYYSISQHWIKQVQEKTSDAIFILVGNKKDKKMDQDQVQKSIIDNFCKEYNCQYIEISAKTGENVEEMFIQLAISVRDRFFPQYKLQNGEKKQNNIKEEDEDEQNEDQISDQRRNGTGSFSIKNKDLGKFGKNKKNKKSGCC
ncbi:P-loop containing nucleoside triphosphate hydrolase [Pseudocohnilembus persalinus]|uniref:p-loop containing nucleoside triphosphate hydrolase n=1 Tax=Pseudocohnilembus persalinus TaxID=266149 RepID=A0A0V0QP62_PSEPJ|nr:P-loop containing nucleoside triphosphate hydrolase [Pseudocohnilembus persalinus]|eukprot:KRX03905.1 P-loop containing nucleoside triphosphate hydrolase [Pseudocohnilembus persalinus]